MNPQPFHVRVARELRGYKTYWSAKSALTRTDARRREDFRDNEIYETKIGWAFFDRQGFIHLPGRIVDPRCDHAVISKIIDP